MHLILISLSFPRLSELISSRQIPSARSLKEGGVFREAQDTNPILHILLTSYNDPLINRLKMGDRIQTRCHMCANVYFAAGKRPHVRPPCFYMNFSNVTTAHASTIIEHKMMRTYIVLIGSRSHFDWLKYSFPSSLHSLTRISKWGLADRLANIEKKVRHHTAISERVLPIFFSNGRHLGFIRQQGHSAQGLGYMLSYPVSTVIGSLKFYWESSTSLSQVWLVYIRMFLRLFLSFCLSILANMFYPIP